MEIDLHGMDLDQAKATLTQLLNETSEREICIIHGYRRGNQLQKWIRQDFRHRRIERKVLTLNQGMTILWVKQG